MDWFLNDRDLRHERVKYVINCVNPFSFIGRTEELEFSKSKKGEATNSCKIGADNPYKRGDCRRRVKHFFSLLM